jgi:hypothetical protein
MHAKQIKTIKFLVFTGMPFRPGTEGP